MRQSRVATAEWADPSVVAENYHFEEGEFWLGRGADENSAPLGYVDDRHICLVSGSRGGKGTTTIINNLCLWPGSVVVVDPKGENASVTAARRGPGSEHCEGLGQAVYVLDPFDVAQVPDSFKSRFNPLDPLDPNAEESIDEAGRIADALVVINPESKDPFWDESARSMVKGLILHVLTAEEFEGRRNLVTIRELITRGDWKAVEVLKKMGETDIASGQALLWEGVRNNMTFDGIIAGIGETFGNMAVNSSKQFESVLQVANRNTEFIDSPGMRRCLSASDFELSDLKTKPEGVSLYLSLPSRHMSTHYRWLRMMIALTVTEMEKVKGRPATGHRVLMCLDEFAGLKRMEVIENAVAQIAGSGVTLFFVLQSLEQLKAAYRDNWETFLSNSGLKIFFNLEDHFSREYVSKFVGDTELIREVRSSSRSESESESRSHSESRSSSRSRSQSTSISTSRSRSKSGGSSRSRNRSTGGSDGLSWKRKFFAFRGDKQFNEGRNRSEGTSDGTNRGWSDGATSGRSRTRGTSSSETYGTSDSTTYGTSHSTTEGTSETVHRRPLIAPDELGKFFGRINDKEHPAYPGLALVLVSGENPIAVKRVNYFEDEYFYKKFDPHPDHGNKITYEFTLRPPAQELLDYAEDDLDLLVREGVSISKGDQLYRIHRYIKKWENSRIDNFLESIPSHLGYPTELVLQTSISGQVKAVKYHEKEVVVETNHPAPPDRSIEQNNQKAIEQYCLQYQNASRRAALIGIGFFLLCVLVIFILLFKSGTIFLGISAPTGSSGFRLQKLATILFIISLLLTRLAVAIFKEIRYPAESVLNCPVEGDPAWRWFDGLLRLFFSKAAGK